MKRPATAPAAPGSTVQLFPFLAVLLCTMGALVLLLVIFARQAALQAENQPPPEVDPQLRDSHDELVWRIEHLTASRTKTAEQLAQMRHTLSHAEDHARRLRDELAQASAALAAIDQPWDASRIEIDRRQRTQLDARRAQLERELAELDQRPAKGTSYAIVPHEGPNHTRRRPIYIECRSDRVIIQPEGIVFPESDFAVLGDPRNPLAAAVRAAAEKVVRQHQFDSSGMPYPLLLVPRRARLLGHRLRLRVHRSRLGIEVPAGRSFAGPGHESGRRRCTPSPTGVCRGPRRRPSAGHIPCGADTRRRGGRRGARWLVGRSHVGRTSTFWCRRRKPDRIQSLRRWRRTRPRVGRRRRDGPIGHALGRRCTFVRR
jgi:hypothetical protein